jgi:hypothetical protein
VSELAGVMKRQSTRQHGIGGKSTNPGLGCETLLCARMELIRKNTNNSSF